MSNPFATMFRGLQESPVGQLVGNLMRDEAQPMVDTGQAVAEEVAYQVEPPTKSCGMIEGSIPISGDLKDGAYALEEGKYLYAAMFFGMAVSDLADGGLLGPDDTGKPLVKGAGKVGEELGEKLAKESEEVVTLWKAPGRGRTGVAEEVVEGFSPQRYPGEGPFFATERSVAESYQYHYQNGLQEINIPKSEYDRLMDEGVVRIDRGEKAAVHVPEKGLGQFNEAIQQGPPNKYHSEYDIYGSQ